MKAVVRTEYGDTSVLRVDDVDEPTPAEGRVTVKVAAAGVNMAEWHLMAGDPTVARLRIGGSFSLTRPDRFAAALPQLLPVHIVRDGAVSEIRMAANMPAQAPAMRLPEK